MSTTARLPAPICRRHRSAAHCRRRSRCCRRRWYRIRRPRPPCSICSPTPMARSRGRRCCRSPHCPLRSTPRVGRLDPTAPRWNFEIPFVTSQGTAMAQFEISRDGGAQRGRSGQGSVARAILARRRARRAGPCADIAERRAHVGADVGGTAGDRGAIACRHPRSSARR